jgi:hypothetical protein
MITGNEWREMSKRGEACAIVGCRNTPLNQCPTCQLHYCSQDIRNHFHIMTDEEVRNQEIEGESFKIAVLYN